MTNQSNSFNPAIKYVSVPEADVHIKESGRDTTLTIENSHPVKIPQNELNDFRIAIRASDINEIRAWLNIRESKFPWAEIMLAIATTAFGLSIGGLISGINLRSWQSIMVVVFLLIAVGTGTAYCFIRKNSIINMTQLAQQILKKLPDPEKEKL